MKNIKKKIRSFLNLYQNQKKEVKKIKNNELNQIVNSYLSFVEKTLNNLNESEKEIIQNNYLDCKDKNWWMEKYDRTSYALLKQKTYEDLYHEFS